MSNHYTVEPNSTTNMETQQEVKGGDSQLKKSIALNSNHPQEPLKYLLNDQERAHQQNKTCSDDSYELLNANELNSNSSSDSYQTKNYATIQNILKTSEECKFWNNGKCNKSSCKYQHFCLKPLFKQNNIEINLCPNEAIQSNKLIIVEVTELKYVPIDQIEYLVTQQLNSDTKRRLIKIAITNKRYQKKLINQIKLNKQNKDASDDESCDDWKEIIKNIDELRNNNKVSSPKSQLTHKTNKKQKTSPVEKRGNSPNYNQLNNKQTIINSNIQASNEENMQRQDSEEENQNGNITPIIQRGEQGRLAQSLGIDSEGHVRQMFINNENHHERILQGNGEDLFVELIKPAGKIGYVQMAQVYSTEQEKIIFKQGLEINEITKIKLITQVKYRKTIENQMKNSDDKFTKLTFFLNKSILTRIFFQNTKAFTKMDNLIPTIKYYNRCCASDIEQHIERWIAEREPFLYQIMKKEQRRSDPFERFLCYYLIPKNQIEITSKQIAQNKTFQYSYLPYGEKGEPITRIRFVFKILKFAPFKDVEAKKSLKLNKEIN